jgi:multidrug efflux pump subunit AcrA (membrane-fusion protein)
MIRKYLLPLVALGLLVFAVIHVVRAQQEPPKVVPPVTPAQSPFSTTVAGAGMVEPRTENIAIGSHLPGVVKHVHVRVNQPVRPGDPLFELDDRQLRADLKARRAMLAQAQAQLQKLDLSPRPEELPVAEARVREAETNLKDQLDQLNRVRSARQAYSAEEVTRREHAYRMAQEQLARAQAELSLLRAGAWEADKAVARAAVEHAQAQVDQIATELERLIVRAPVVRDPNTGEELQLRVLQVNVRPGEFVGAPPGQALVVLGNVEQLHVRVDIDEHDIPRFREGAPAAASPRGQPQVKLPLTFVRVEPYVIPKRALTGDNTERVDTRVLQVIYTLNPGVPHVYVGQQLDVFINLEGTNGSKP